MLYSKLLVLFALTTDVFGFSVGGSPLVGIIGGDPVPISDVPYMADLRRDWGYHWCGASIVHERFLLTAAHCFDEKSKYTVAVGTDNAQNGIKYEVDKFIFHEKYPENRVDYDICLVKLKKEIAYGPNVTSVRLADVGFEYKPGMMVNASGWGRTAIGGHNSEVLRRVSIPVMDQRECVKIYGSTRITDNMFCAGAINSGKGTWAGDGGGPLMWNDVQMGITAFGATKKDYPAVYTKISAFKQWLIETIDKNN